MRCAISALADGHYWRRPFSVLRAVVRNDADTLACPGVNQVWLEVDVVCAAKKPVIVRRCSGSRLAIPKLLKAVWSITGSEDRTAGCWPILTSAHLT